MGFGCQPTAVPPHYLAATTHRHSALASTYNAGSPSWSNLLFLKELSPDANETYQNFTVDEGLLYMVCWGGSPDIAIDNAGSFVVVE